jgi:hypothetical protein
MDRPALLLSRFGSASSAGYDLDDFAAGRLRALVFGKLSTRIDKFGNLEISPKPKRQIEVVLRPKPKPQPFRAEEILGFVCHGIFPMPYNDKLSGAVYPRPLERLVRRAPFPKTSLCPDVRS